MLTSSVNVVQSAFPEKDQGEISGLSRSVSNLGSSLGTAIAGSVLVTTLVVGNHVFELALATVTVFAFIGLGAALLLPREPVPSVERAGAAPSLGQAGERQPERPRPRQESTR
jgi:nitrate/nitrite transporter NarK